MTLSKIITAATVIAAIIWMLAGFAEMAAGNHGLAVSYACIAVLALAIEAAWSFFWRASQR